MEVEEIFQPKTKKAQIAKEWEEAERGKDPLVEYWKERKRERSICIFQEKPRPKSTR